MTKYLHGALSSCYNPVMTKPAFFLAAFLFALAFPLTLHSAPVSYDKLEALFDQRDFKSLESACQENLRAVPKGEELYLETLFFLIAQHVYQEDFGSAAPYMISFREVHTAREAELTKKNGASYTLIDARFPGLYYELGKYYFETEDWSEAARWLRMAKTGGAIAKDPMLFFRLGVSCMKSGEQDQARKYFDEQLRLDPDEPSPYYNMACSYAMQKNKTKALEWLKRAVAAYPDFGSQAFGDPDFGFLKTDPDFKKIVSGK